nr:TNF receptor-associated factor 3-like [Dermacentor andersoni]
MPDHGLERVHRFRDHVLAGVNWRPTRFVDEVPSSRVCSLCRMIPKRVLLLPCGHALCQSCHAASLEGGVGQCPLDQVQIEEAECFGYEFPTRIANTLKVYCWNEAHGCEYTGTMDRMLEHYQNECTFHTVECLRCGEGVQHRDLPTHYAAGCSAGVSSGITECRSSERTALSLEDVNAVLKELKARLGDANHDRLLPEIQSHFNELKEVRSQQTMFAGIPREIGASERNLKAEMDQITAKISATMSHQPTSLQNPEEEDSTSTSLSLRSEMALILRKLERLAPLENLRQNSLKPESRRVIAHCSILEVDCRHLYSALSTTDAWIKRIGALTYDLTLENSEKIIKYRGPLKKFAEITVWHMRDTYFTVAVWKWSGFGAPRLSLEIEFNGTLVDSRCVPPFWQVSVWDNAMLKHRLLTSSTMSCYCVRYDKSLLHFHLEFRIAIPSLQNCSFMRDGKILFRICLSDGEMDRSVKGEP